MGQRAVWYRGRRSLKEHSVLGLLSYNSPLVVGHTYIKISMPLLLDLAWITLLLDYKLRVKNV